MVRWVKVILGGGFGLLTRELELELQPVIDQVTDEPRLGLTANQMAQDWPLRPGRPGSQEDDGSPQMPRFP